MERRKDNMVAALWANDGFNDDKGSRQNAIEEIESQYQAACIEILGDRHTDEIEIEKDNPFFRPVFDGMKKLDERLDGEGTVAARVEQEDDYSKYIDQN